MMPIKKNPYASPGEKLIGLYSVLLFSGRAYSLPRLAELFHCSKQTILRMMDQIQRTQRLEVESWLEDSHRWYRANPPKTPIDAGMRPRDLQNLLLCRDLVQHMLPIGMRAEIDQTLEMRQPPGNGGPDAAPPPAAVPVRNLPKGRIDYAPFEAQFSALLQGMQDKRICQVTYLAHDRREPKEFPVAPLELLSVRDALYFKCRLEKAFAGNGDYYDPILALQRIQVVTLTDRPFALPDDEPEPAGQTFGLMPGKPFRLKVRFSEKAAAYVSERQWSADQTIERHPDGSLILEMTATSEPEVVAWVLSFGKEAQMLDPEETVTQVKEQIKEMLQNIISMQDRPYPKHSQ